MRTHLLLGSCAALAGVVASACTVLTSETPTEILERGGRPAGVYYALPVGLVLARLSADPDTREFEVDITGPEYIPDPTHRYYFRYRPRANYKDVIELKVNDNSFPKKAWVTSEDRTNAILVNIAQALSALPGTVEADEAPTKLVDLDTFRFDPADRDAVSAAVQRLNDSILRYVKVNAASCQQVTAITTFDKFEGPDGGEITAATSIKERIDQLDKVIESAKKETEKLTKDAKKLSGTKNAAIEAHRKCLLRDICFPDPTVYPDLCAEFLPTPPPAKSSKIQPSKQTPPAPEPVCPSGDAAKDRLKSLLEVIGLKSAEREARKTELDQYSKSKRNEKKTHKDFQQGCSGWSAMLKDSRRPKVVIDVHDYRRFGTDAGGNWAPSADCQLGLCYRVKEPYRIDYRIETGGVQRGSRTRIVELPNRSPLIALELDRAFLVTKITNIDFDDNGFLQKVYVEKPSELVALSQLPLNVLKAIGDGISLRAQIVSKQRDVVQKEVALLKAQSDLARVQAPRTESGALPALPSRRSGGGASSFPQEGIAK